MIERGKKEIFIEKVASKTKKGKTTKYLAKLIVVTVPGNLKTSSSKYDFSIDGNWDIKKERNIYSSFKLGNSTVCKFLVFPESYQFACVNSLQYTAHKLYH